MKLGNLIRSIIFGALFISALVFIIIPFTTGYSVSDIKKMPQISSIMSIWSDYPDQVAGGKFKKADKQDSTKDTPPEEEIVRKDRIWYIPVILVLVCILIYGLWYLAMNSRNKILASQLVYFKIVPFGDYELSSMASAQEFLRGLSQNMRQPWDAMILGQPWFRYIIKKTSGDGTIQMFFGVPGDRTVPFLNGFAGYYAKVQLKPLTEEQAKELIPESKHYKVSTFSLLTKDPLPIRVFEAKSGEPDPLNIILNGTGGGKPSDIDVVIDILMKPVSESKHLYKVGSEYIRKLKDERSDTSDIPGLLAGIGRGGEGNTNKKQKTMSEFEKDHLKAVKDRSTAPEKAFSTSIRIYATGGGEDDLLMALKSTSDSFSSLNAFNSLVAEPIVDAWRMKKKILEGRLGVKEGFILSTSELMAFVRIPDSTIESFVMVEKIDSGAIRAPQSITSREVEFNRDSKKDEEMYLVNVNDEEAIERLMEQEWNYTGENAEEEQLDVKPHIPLPKTTKPDVPAMEMEVDPDDMFDTISEEELEKQLAAFDNKIQKAEKVEKEDEKEKVKQPEEKDEDIYF